MKTSHTLSLRIATLALVNAPWVGSALAQTTEAPVQTPGTAPGAPAAAPGWLNFALLGGMIFFMYLFIIRPQAKRQKEHKAFLDSLRTGQEVITSSGLIGKITSISDSVVTVDLGSTNVRVLKSAISGELKGGVNAAAITPAT